jgi:hypothetical protein
LNSELERLRRAVPTLPQRDSSDLAGPPKPSKAIVLASAIDYIKAIKAERDKLLEENERLRDIASMSTETSQKLNRCNCSDVDKGALWDLSCIRNVDRNKRQGSMCGESATVLTR